MNLERDLILDNVIEIKIEKTEWSSFYLIKFLSIDWVQIISKTMKEIIFID